MGKTVSGAVGAIVNPVVNTVNNIGKDIGDGKPLAAIGDIVGGTGSGTNSDGSGILGLAKGMIVGAGVQAVGGLKEDLTTHPTEAISGGIMAYETGGASLVPSAVQAGSSILSGQQGRTPTQIASFNGGAAPSDNAAAMLPERAAPNNNMIAVAAIAGIGLIIYLRK